MPLTNFFSAEEYHQKYLDKNPGGYCHIPDYMFTLGKSEASSEDDAPEEKGILERLYMAILKTNEIRIRLLIERHQLYILEDKVKEILKPILCAMYAGNTLSDKEIDYLLEYQLAASFGVIAKWFHSQDLTDQEITHLLIECSMTGAVNILNSGMTMEGPEAKATRNNEILSRIISELETQKEE